MSLIGVRAILFDLDGTLVDSAPDLATAVNRMLSALDRGMVSEAKVRHWIGNGARRLVARALTGEDRADPPQDHWNEAMELFYAHYSDCLTERTTVYPGARQALDALASTGFALGVVTNKPMRFTDRLLSELGLDGYFGVTVSGDTLAVKKPDPAPLRLAAESLGVDIVTAIMVGDSMADVAAARNAGIPVVCVPYGYRREADIFDARPDAVVDRLDHLPPLLGRVAQREPASAVAGRQERDERWRP